MEISRIKRIEVSSDFSIEKSDAGKFIIVNNTTVVNVTIPNDDVEHILTGTLLRLQQFGNEQLVFVPADGVTLRAVKRRTNGQYAVCSLLKLGYNEWTMFDDITDIALENS